jgi:hypothetical protein
MQRRCKDFFPTIERLRFLRGQCTVVIPKSSKAGREASKGVEFRYVSLQGYELRSRGTELNWYCRIMARKVFGGAKRISCMI